MTDRMTFPFEEPYVAAEDFDTFVGCLVDETLMELHNLLPSVFPEPVMGSYAFREMFTDQQGAYSLAALPAPEPRKVWS